MKNASKIVRRTKISPIRWTQQKSYKDIKVNERIKELHVPPTFPKYLLSPPPPTSPTKKLVQWTSQTISTKLIKTLITVRPPPPLLEEMEKVSYGDFMERAGSGDLLMSGGPYAISEVLRSVHQCRTSHLGLIVVPSSPLRGPRCNEPEKEPISLSNDKEAHLLTSFSWEIMLPEFPTHLMVDVTTNQVECGVTMHPLRPYVDAELSIDPNIDRIIWRRLLKRVDKNPTKTGTGTAVRELEGTERQEITGQIMRVFHDLGNLKYPTALDFLRRLRGREERKPGDESSMSCWEIVAETLYRIGVIPRIGKTWKAANVDFEQGRTMDREWHHDSTLNRKAEGEEGGDGKAAYLYGPEIQVMDPVESMFGDIKEWREIEIKRKLEIHQRNE